MPGNATTCCVIRIIAGARVSLTNTKLMRRVNIRGVRSGARIPASCGRTIPFQRLGLALLRSLFHVPSAPLLHPRPPLCILLSRTYAYVAEYPWQGGGGREYRRALGSRDARVLRARRSHRAFQVAVSRALYSRINFGNRYVLKLFHGIR